MSSSGQARPDCDYVVVGSGAGGGTLAARLVEAGHTVVLIEAGGDPRGLGITPAERQALGLPNVYDVPAFHPRASETDEIAWDFFVRHYSSDEQQQRDPKYAPGLDGVLYPRGGTLGGCTAINDLILMCPRGAAWDRIAALTGDPSWRAEHMRTYFERLENCHHRPLARWLGKLGINPSRHGWDGWLSTEVAVTPAELGDRRMVDVIRTALPAVLEQMGRPASDARGLAAGHLDPNDWRVVRTNAEQLCYTPLTTSRHQRTGSRERILETMRRYPDRLSLELNALATRVLFGEQNRAIGIEYLKGERLFRANGRASTDAGERRQIHVAREIILAGGAFNTPQLLMLSGIGPRDVLERHGIGVRVDLSGVGRNLKDNYEVSVVNRMNFASWPALQNAKFTDADPLHLEWARARTGLYNTVGTLLGVLKRSAVHFPAPDLFCYALAEHFRGYFKGYSQDIRHRNYLTWVVVKGETHNRAGTVTLRSSDPRDAPLIDFRYFHEGDDADGDDLRAIVDGIRFVRGMTTELKRTALIAEEELPGDRCQSDEDLREFVRAQAWGTAASGTCSIGPSHAQGVLTSDFRVHGTKNLRVVDASTFPRSPGFFIAGAVYMIGEKAADVILADAAPTSV